MSAPNYIKYVRHDTLGTEYINSSIEMASSAKFYYDSIPSRMKNWHEIQQMLVTVTLAFVVFQFDVIVEMRYDSRV